MAKEGLIKALKTLKADAEKDASTERESIERSFEAMPLDERREKVWQMKLQGVSVLTIAKVFKVSAQTIRNDLSAMSREYRKNIEQTDAVDIIADSLLFYSKLEEFALYELADCKSDPQRSREAHRFLQSVIAIRERKVRLMVETGIIPREPERLYAKVESVKPRDEKSEDHRSPEEIQSSIKQLLTIGRALPDLATVEIDDDE
jgi:hypothetical protein